jgi:hypothetical protein
MARRSILETKGIVKIQFLKMRRGEMVAISLTVL